jgi:hypothetical protein
VFSCAEASPGELEWLTLASKEFPVKYSIELASNFVPFLRDGHVNAPVARVRLKDDIKGRPRNTEGVERTIK